MDVEFLRWQFIDGHYGVVTKNRFRIGIRHLQMLYMLATSITFGLIRGSLGVTVLAINDHTRRNDTYIKVHNWDGRIQGAVLSSFFMGYAVMLIPSEILLRKIGGRFLTTTLLLVNGALCVAMPTIINKGGWIAACNANLLMGMTHACFFVVHQSLLDSWLPPSERKIFNYIIYGGVQVGIIIALPISGLLTTAALSWELVYYSLAMLGLSMAVIIGTLTASTPDSHPAVGDTEKELIKESVKYYRKKDLRKPWRDILKSYRFWAATCAHAASNCLFIFFLVYTPTYLMTSGISLKDSSYYSMIPFIAMAAIFVIVEPTMNGIYNIKYIYYIFSASFYRKTINALGAIGIIMGLTMLLEFPYKWNCPAIIALTAVLGCLGFQFCGFLNTYRDMSENFSGTMMMLSCAFSSGIGGGMTFVFGLILGDNLFDLLRWRVIFLTLATLYLICNIIYTIFSSNERQRWDIINDKKHTGHFNAVMNINQVHLEENGHMTIDTAL